MFRVGRETGNTGIFFWGTPFLGPNKSIIGWLSTLVCLCVSQDSSFWRSCCRVLQSFLLLTVKNIAVSSAKSLTCEWICSGRSFIYNKNRIGPKTDPWGTPDVTEI